MLDSIYTGMTGLLGFSSGLRTISNNTANMNTPGFKGSTLQFADLFYSDGNLNGGHDGGQIGFGLGTRGTSINFKQGELRNSNNDLDLAIDGLGMFVVRDSAGQIHHTRAGQFEFDSTGILVDKLDRAKVLGLDGGGNFVDISVAGLRTNSAQATGSVKFTGNLSSTATTQNATATVLDAAGAAHSLSLAFTNITGSSSTTNSTWSLSVTDGSTPVGSGLLTFSNGNLNAATGRVTFTYAPAGVASKVVTFDFSSDVTSFASGNVTNLAMASRDGHTAGGLVKSTFDADGVLTLTYSNGQTVQGASLAVSHFDTIDAVRAIGGSRFDAIDPKAWHIGRANKDIFGSIRGATLEASNVDLSSEFSELVIMQRGYQSSSQVISTANEMLQELFTMRGK
ncbi:flagellar hook-basal body complex protein [Herbaspirillum seropedicae]|uniref:flagellar hook-basal body complex protein n=1 Tax=Herbaspirillum seropedicae TaxID=964 RepID=UPI003D96C41B